MPSTRSRPPASRGLRAVEAREPTAMEKMRVALVGLGMAVTPHAKSLRDLSARLELAYAFTPTEERRSGAVHAPSSRPGQPCAVFAEQETALFIDFDGNAFSTLRAAGAAEAKHQLPVAAHLQIDQHLRAQLLDQ